MRSSVVLVLVLVLGCTQTRNVRLPISHEVVRTCVAACEGTIDRFQCLRRCPGRKVITDGACPPTEPSQEACAQRAEGDVPSTVAAVVGVLLGVAVVGAVGLLLLIGGASH